MIHIVDRGVRWVEPMLAKCRVRDTEPAPALGNGDTLVITYHHPTETDLPLCIDTREPPAGVTVEMGLHGLHICESPTPLQPWRRGPLAAWTLVNISAHDGRLTVVMKRGRGELIDETGPDDETLWERLSAKVVEFEKAKYK